MTEISQLEELVREGEFRARRDADLIGADPDLDWAAFSHLQRLYRTTTDASVKKRVALDFQRLVRKAHEEAAKSSGMKLPIKSVNLRLPEELHRELKETSTKSGRSLQREIVWLIEEALVFSARSSDSS